MTIQSVSILLLAITPVFGQPEKTAWEVLKAPMNDKNPDRRRQAITAAGSIGLAPDAVQFVEQGLKDNDPLVRQTAAAELGEMKAKQSIPALKRVVSDDDSAEVAFTAAKSLWEMGDRSGRDVIEDVLTGQQKTSESLVGGAVRDVKRKIHDPKSLALMGFKEASGAILGPFNLGLIAAEQAMKDGSGGARTLAATILADECDVQTQRLLQRTCTDDKNWAVRAAAARSLGKCANQDSIPKLEQALSDSRDAVRLMAAAAIIRLSVKQGD